ncbi:MAG TPA: transporter substrate-binding domain-containing protein [Solirubrobacterales bacterium]|nr:transporter substrate-binding domain-containing protein [Solirubrobacterales bacterium]
MSKTRLWTLLVLVVGLVAAFAVAGCGDDDGSSTSTDSTDATTDTADLGLIEEGTLIVGSDIPFPPFEQGDPPDYEGFDIDLINAVAENLGLETQIEDAPFDLLLQGGGGQFDLAIAATTIKPARENRVDFSDPYFLASQALLVRSDGDVQSAADLSGKIVAAQDGTTGETYANDNTDAKEVRGFPEIDDAYNALEVGQVDAVINDLPSAQDAADNKDGLEVVETFETDELYGIIIPEESDALREAVNGALVEIKEDGTLNDLYQEWFKVDVPESLLTETHEPS